MNKKIVILSSLIFLLHSFDGRAAISSVDTSHSTKDPLKQALQKETQTGLLQNKISLLTYNVHGIPQNYSFMTSSSLAQETDTRMEKIASLIKQKQYDVVSLQEVWTKDVFNVFSKNLSFEQKFYFDEKGKSFYKIAGSGLAQFLGKLPVVAIRTLHFDDCHGRLGDCGTSKGAQLVTVSLTNSLNQKNLQLDIYNTHLDADVEEGDIKARKKQVDQLVAFIKKNSGNKPFIIMGDLNMRPQNLADHKQLQDLKKSFAGLKDVCDELSCSQYKENSVDYVLFRNSQDSKIALKPTSWDFPNDFVYINSKKQKTYLSDHKPIAVDFHIEILD